MLKVHVFIKYGIISVNLCDETGGFTVGSPIMILLPCQGKPVDRIWLPRSHKPEDLAVAIRASDGGSSAALRRAEELGLRTIVRLLGVFDASRLLVWICWVQSGDTPRDLEEMPVSEALNHPVFGPMVRMILQKQRNL
jgi:hypothetical protein